VARRGLCARRRSGRLSCWRSRPTRVLDRDRPDRRVRRRIQPPETETRVSRRRIAGVRPGLTTGAQADPVRPATGAERRPRSTSTSR
jgi:hypothetical protein